MKMQWLFIMLTGIFLVGCVPSPTVDLGKNQTYDKTTKEETEHNKAKELIEAIKKAEQNARNALDGK